VSFVGSEYEEWDQIYRKYPLESLGWELGRPRQVLVEFVEKRLVKKGKALDVCCGAGTNTVYLAQKGFEVTAMDISTKAIEYAKKKVEQARFKINFMLQSFVDLPFRDGVRFCFRRGLLPPCGS
jgi:ubiquinone/menaquinone biosynthesis C-methylase UbiE